MNKWLCIYNEYSGAAKEVTVYYNYKPTVILQFQDTIAHNSRNVNASTDTTVLFYYQLYSYMCFMSLHLKMHLIWRFKEYKLIHHRKHVNTCWISKTRNEGMLIKFILVINKTIIRCGEAIACFSLSGINNKRVCLKINEALYFI